MCVGILLLAGCQGGTDRKVVENHTFTDDYGREVSVPAAPQRVVSASPAVTEILYALGAEELLVARTDYCNYPPQATQLPSIGGISNLNVEAILALNPDLVISGSMIPKKATYHLDKMGVPSVCVIEKSHFEGLYENIAKIGQLVGYTRQAGSLIAVLKQRMEQMTPPTTDSPSLYYVVGFGAGGNFTAGGNSFINDIIQMAGYRNIAEEITGWNFSLEALMNADPDYILIRQEDAERFCSTEPYDQLSAVKQGHVIPIESGCIDLQVPRNLDAVEAIRQAIN